MEENKQPAPQIKKATRKKKRAAFFRVFDPRWALLDLCRSIANWKIWIGFQPRFVYEDNDRRNRTRVKGRAILISNHTCWQDPFVTNGIFWRRRLFSLMAEDIAGTGFKRWFYRQMGCIPVNRERPALSTYREAGALLFDDHLMQIFPEGRVNYTSDEGLLPFKEGAAFFAVKTDSPVIPLYICGPLKLFRRNYFYVGKPLDLSPADGIKNTSERIAVVNRIMQTRMDEIKRFMDDYVANLKNHSARGTDTHET